MADPIADSEKVCITDMLKGYIDYKELQDIVERLHEHGFSAQTLQSMPSSEINDLILEYFPEGSTQGAKTGFRMAIQRRKESTHGSSSTPLMENVEKTVKENTEKMDSLEKTFKRMREEAELDRKSKKSFSISGIKPSDWDILGPDTGYEWHDPQYTPTRLSDLPAFGWDDRQERTQADSYMAYLSQIRRSRRWMIIDAANRHLTLLSGELNDYRIRGTSDVAVILRQGKIFPKGCVRCIFELKKKDIHQGVHQILVSLLMVNTFSRQFRPFAVLTDLIDDWMLYWMDEARVYYTQFESRAVAVGTVEDLLGEDQDMGHSSRLPFLATKGVGSGGRDYKSGHGDPASVLFNRRMYVPPGTENMEDLVGFIPDDEINSARNDAGLRHAQQMLLRDDFA